MLKLRRRRLERRQRRWTLKREQWKYQLKLKLR